METSLADGLAVAEVGANAFSIAAPLVDKMVFIYVYLLINQSMNIFVYLLKIYILSINRLL